MNLSVKEKGRNFLVLAILILVIVVLDYDVLKGVYKSFTSTGLNSKDSVLKIVVFLFIVLVLNTLVGFNLYNSIRLNRLFKIEKNELYYKRFLQDKKITLSSSISVKIEPFDSKLGFVSELIRQFYGVNFGDKVIVKNGISSIVIARNMSNSNAKLIKQFISKQLDQGEK